MDELIARKKAKLLGKSRSQSVVAQSTKELLSLPQRFGQPDRLLKTEHRNKENKLVHTLYGDQAF